MSARRKPQTDAPSDRDIPPLTTTMPASTIPPPTSPRRSPFLPTRLEALLISIYPLTLLLGSIFSTLSSTTRSAPYSPTLQSHPPELAPSYFAKKKNIFNVYFVKFGWFWTTLAFAVFVLTNPGLGEPLRPYVTRKRVRATLRWAAATAWWGAVTQWFFGPPLIDRGFRFTGGQCELLSDLAARDGASDARELLTAVMCKRGGGTWKGGHDISGHVFLLILGSGLLWFEILPALTRAEGLRDGRRVRLGDGKVASVAVEKQAESSSGKRSEAQEQVTAAGVKAALGVAALMWWMLLMTAAFFHTWFEKFTGLLVAFVGLWVVYFLPRGVPWLRAILGMPGV